MRLRSRIQRQSLRTFQTCLMLNGRRLGQKRKKPYEEKYHAEKEAYLQRHNKKNKKEKDPLKPKHLMSAYFLFTNDRRAALLAEKKGIMEVIELTSCGERRVKAKKETKEPKQHDLSEHHNRLSLTCKENYLTQTEKEILDAKEDNKPVDLEVVVLDPNFRDFTMSLKKWKMSSASGNGKLHFTLNDKDT
ncbi:B3 domain-containing protein [Trifolium repens]|nr:B3 domain-containing protein [Trifolium repens]